jgi:hypothetical protein
MGNCKKIAMGIMPINAITTNRFQENNCDEVEFSDCVVKGDPPSDMGSTLSAN